ncbi:unnamed protein product [Prunus armeniaca]
MDVRDQYKNGGKVSVEDGATWEREGERLSRICTKDASFLTLQFQCCTIFGAVSKPLTVASSFVYICHQIPKLLCSTRDVSD